MNLFVIGYYGHYNIGDEQYKITFTHVLKKYLGSKMVNIQFIDCDKIFNYSFDEKDIIILGGGDVLNNYFLDKIILKFKNKKNKIIAVSVGIPYTSIVSKHNKLSYIDYIFIRTKQDFDMLSKHYFPHRIKYIPDLSYYLNDYVHTSYVSILDNKFQDLSLIKISKKIIGINLNRHIYNPNDINNYNKFINTFSVFVEKLISDSYYIVFLPYNTNINSFNENDILIHNDVINLIKPELRNNIKNIDYTLSVEETYYIYKYFYATVCMRYHACLFSLYNNVPFLALYTTRKIKNLMKDIYWNNFYELDTDENDFPINLSYNVLQFKFNMLVENYSKSYNLLLSNNRNINKKNYISSPGSFLDVLFTDYNKISNSRYHEISVEEIKQNIYDYIISREIKNNNNNDNDTMDLSFVPMEERNNIVQLTSYYLTGTLNSIYNHGMYLKMFNKNYRYNDEWKWVIEDHNKNHPNNFFNNSYGLFNLEYIDQHDYSGSHRSGWQYVYSNIKYLHNENSNLYLDLYVDRTFHWNKDINKYLGIIPYKKNWMGFIHHTFDTTMSDYNCYTLLKSDEFIKSLSYCKGLIVLSHYLGDKLKKELDIFELNVPIYVMCHPSEVISNKFTYSNFLKNKEKKLLHVGGWLRNIYSFYNLSINTVKHDKKFNLLNCFVPFIKNASIKKVAIRGKGMTNYYPSDNFLCNLEDFLEKPGSICDAPKNCSQDAQANCSQGAITNIWYKKFYEDIKSKICSVSVINFIENKDYDKLLSENIIFLNLIDASAVNTIIECIMRNTPIIVNKIDPVVELLGPHYPMYYNNGDYYSINEQVKHLLTYETIEKTTKYLQIMDKKRFHIDYFVNELINIVSTNNN